MLTERINKVQNGSGPAGEPEQDWLVSLVRERLGKRHFYALAAAVREHEAVSGEHRSPADEALYRQLRLICGEL